MLKKKLPQNVVDDYEIQQKKKKKNEKRQCKTISRLDQRRFNT